MILAVAPLIIGFYVFKMSRLLLRTTFLFSSFNGNKGQSVLIYRSAFNMNHNLLIKTLFSLVSMILLRSLPKTLRRYSRFSSALQSSVSTRGQSSRMSYTWSFKRSLGMCTDLLCCAGMPQFILFDFVRNIFLQIQASLRKICNLSHSRQRLWCTLKSHFCLSWIQCVVKDFELLRLIRLLIDERQSQKM